MLKRLRLKFVLVNMSIVTVMLCVIFSVVFYTTYRNLENESVRMMRMLADAPEPGMPGRPGEVPEQVRLPFFTLDIGPDGKVDAKGGGYYDLSDEAFLDRLVKVALSSEERVGVITPYNLRFLRVELPRKDRLIFSDISSERSAIGHLIRNSLLIGLASFVVFLGISILLARWAIKPVEKAWNQQRQFVADASHELKTPLTVITTNAELLQNPDCGKSERLQFSGSILAMSKQMRTLTESLLTQARVDSGVVKAAFSKVDLSRTVEDAILPFEPVYFEKGLALTAHIAAGIFVRGSEGHLRQVAEIFLDNAQKYSSHHGETVISLQRQGRQHCLLSVSSPGEAISQEDLKNIFKRFYRIDQARTSDGSYGLGLSIAEQIVEEHGGKIWAESTNGINTFFVQLHVI